MLMNKVYVGKIDEGTLQIQYFVIEKEKFYGIALEEKKNDCIECAYEYFTEEQQEALHLAQKMYQGKVTLTSITEILDDYIQ